MDKIAIRDGDSHLDATGLVLKKVHLALYKLDVGLGANSHHHQIALDLLPALQHSCGHLQQSALGDECQDPALHKLDVGNRSSSYSFPPELRGQATGLESAALVLVVLIELLHCKPSFP